MGKSGVHGLHHWAYRCRDGEETRHFYEDILGLPLVYVITGERVPSTNEDCPHAHLFFRMDDGSHLAFFDLADNKITRHDPDTPEWVNHMALLVPDQATMDRMKSRLLANGIDVLGPTDHPGGSSIYFFDPNGYRMEFTVRKDVGDYMDRKELSAHDDLATWQNKKTVQNKIAA